MRTDDRELGWIVHGQLHRAVGAHRQAADGSVRAVGQRAEVPVDFADNVVRGVRTPLRATVGVVHPERLVPLWQHDDERGYGARADELVCRAEEAVPLPFGVGAARAVEHVQDRVARCWRRVVAAGKVDEVGHRLSEGRTEEGVRLHA